MTALPSIEEVRSLPAHLEVTVPDDCIDANGDLDTTGCSEFGAWAPWEHHLRHLGDPLSVRPAFVGTGLSLRR